MRILFTALLCSLLFVANAASFPVAPVRHAPITDSTLAGPFSRMTPKAIEEATGKKLGMLQKLQVKILQKKLKKQLRSEDDSTSSSTKALSVISLVTSGLGLILLFTAASGAFLIFALAGVVTGIIALSNNNSRQHRTMAILGLVLGGVAIILLGIVILAFVGGW